MLLTLLIVSNGLLVAMASSTVFAMVAFRSKQPDLQTYSKSSHLQKDWQVGSNSWKTCPMG